MILPAYETALRVAGGLTILNQRTGALEPFTLNRAQRRILKKALSTKRLAIGKIRQAGCSTVFVYLMMLIAISNPGLPMAIVADEQDKANGLLGKVKAWLGQLGLPLAVSNTESITLANGASIDALTALSPSDGSQESRVGRSKSYGFILATEMAFWRNARAVWAALTSTMLTTAMLVVESTGTAGDSLFREIIEGQSGWVVDFIGVEQHENYRADPDSISDELFAQLQDDYKFTRRDSAAWWHHKLVDDLKGDVFRMLREYPVIRDHMFLYAAGQHIQKWIDARVRRFGAYHNPFEKRDDFEWDVYVEDALVDEPVAIGVDTATGVSKDASGLAIVGQRTGRTIRTYRRNTIVIPDFIAVLKEAVDEWQPVATVIESNGVGAGVWAEMRRYPGAHAVEHWSSGRANKNDSELHQRRALMKYEIESGIVPIGGHLLHEAKNSIVTERATFEGPDDVLSALSIVRGWIAKHPATVEQPRPDPRVVYQSPIGRKARMRM